ncbi:unnamed protein product [Citrullus colocynthis]|uniref:Protein kinase domain-containing protein n=1 Tax=Citrullus colocynthis TaxID=252529 RepID=A0ABP0XVF5_9ROSI
MTLNGPKKRLAYLEMMRREKVFWNFKEKESHKIEEIIKRYSTQTPKRYNYSKLKKITDSFKNKLGQGGFSIVYKGKLPSGCNVAVKLLNESRQENGQDFINEVVSIAKTSHVNIVTLLGFCYEQNKRALVYEYMPKGSLDKYISHNRLQENDMKLDWNMLYNVVIGVARGLEYLHRGCITRILHFDIKPHNILLDDDFCPKISDFGLAKQCKAKESHVSMTGVKGTVGFIAPEVIFRKFGKVSHKSDVYSYGMLVLEMVGARKNPNSNDNDGVEQSSEEYFPDWIYNNLTQSEIDGGCWWGNTEEEEEMARKMITVGLHCIQTLPDDRPSMTDVVAMLESSVDGLQIPPKPNLFGPPTTDLLQAAAGPQRNNVELDWNTLYSIIIGVARGLEYLHRGCITRILHFDIKPHNILLDSDFCPKISDFGLAKQCKDKESHVSMTGVKGTTGFIAPEVIFRSFGKVSHKSDVYSYGMLVLEMVGARKNPNDNDGVEQRSEEYFPDWIYKDLTQSEIDGGCWWGNTEEEEEMARKMIIVGLHCIQTLPDDRPSMTDVVVMLEGSVDGLQIPPKPKLLEPPAIEQPQPSSSSSNWISNDSLIF